MEQGAEDGLEGEADCDSRGRTGGQQADIAYHTGPGTSTGSRDLVKVRGAIDGSAGPIQHSATSDKDRSSDDNTDNDVETNVKTGIGQLLNGSVLALRGDGVQDEVHANKGGTDERHGIHQAAFGNDRNQTGYDLAQVGGQQQ